MPGPSLSDALKRPPTGPVHLVPFYPGGFVSPEATRLATRAMTDAGASVVEVGVPFSDPIADGPTIQAAYHETLSAGVTVTDALDAGRPDDAAPRLAMVSFSLVRRRGPEAFVAKLAEFGYAGVLCPDLPSVEAEAFCGVARAGGVDPVLLVAPTTPAARRDQIGKLAGGFVYYLSVAGITGERDALPGDLADGVADMRGRTDLPIAVGFGISRHEHLQALSGVADAAIVGSAFVRAASEAASGAPGGDADRRSDAVATACRELTGRLLRGGAD